VLADHGIERISLGVQSFIESETRAFGRPQHADEVHAALGMIRELDFPILNIDLIYGDAAQSRTSWLQSLKEALNYEPEELYLYPLYVRPETGLARVGHQAAEHRTDLYRAGRDWLVEQDYEQLSLRCFRRRNADPEQHPKTNYSCQQDDMIGLGCGARSYTRELHYATRFAVTQAGVKAILNEWISQSDADLGLATHGIRLTENEQIRRFVIMSLLQRSGLSLTEYATRFRRTLSESVPELDELRCRHWLHEANGMLTLTAAGIENSDIVGPMLYSESVRARLREFVQL
jgi:oxygen-independent coproporphyrinogen-3 oxidase